MRWHLSRKTQMTVGKAVLSTHQTRSADLDFEPGGLSEIAAAQTAPPPHRAAIDPHDPERSAPTREK
jgi:hypothetical protein